jgi:hypothetical protein
VATTSVPVPLLSVCCVCKHVAETVSQASRWTPMSVYLEQHQLRPTEVRMSHTYCPHCYELQARAWSLPLKKPSVGKTTRRAA